MINFFNWITRYKILHLVFWFVKYISLAHELFQDSRLTVPRAYLDAFWVMFFQAVTVYTMVYYFFPKFFHHKKYAQFFLLTLGLLIATSFLSMIISEYTTRLFFNPNHHARYLTIFISAAIDTFIVVFIFLMTWLFIYFYDKDRKNKIIENERLTTELNFLKAQLNPHFLFNAINSVYVLIEEDKDLASRTLLKFSSLLRYQLYECNSNITTIENEINFIKDYIELEKVRNNINISVNVNFPKAGIYVQIAPFLLIPFVENAFKHLSKYTDKPNSIYVDMTIEDDSLTFVVENTFEDKSAFLLNDKQGIGLQNVKRRLELLYHNAHVLKIEQTNNIYKVKLNLKVK